MNKIAFITDTHFSARDGSKAFHDYFEKFFKETFFPYCITHDIKTVVHGGDFWDKRKFCDFYSLRRVKEYFLNPLRDAGMNMVALLGNHDLYYKTTLQINSPSLLLEDSYNNIEILNAPIVKEFGNTKILIVPWICAENRNDCFDAIKNTTADICFGHFDIIGFEMNKAFVSKSGFDKQIFSKFDMVFSGHYHTRNTHGNITYLGSPYQMTHIDQGETRGFHIFDTDTREVEFVKNPEVMFLRYVYDDEMSEPLDYDISLFKDKFVKIIVNKKNDLYKFDRFIKRIMDKAEAHDIKIIEDVNSLSHDEMNEEIDIEDTQMILEHFVNTADVPNSIDKLDVSNYIKHLYIESINISSN